MAYRFGLGLVFVFLAIITITHDLGLHLILHILIRTSLKSLGLYSMVLAGTWIILFSGLP